MAKVNAMDTLIFIFRRDLRLHDNTTWIEAVKVAHNKGYNLLPVFIFNPEQIDPERNAYFNNNQVQFMIESLQGLNEELKQCGGRLHYYYGSDIDVITDICKVCNVKVVAFNQDITPFAIKRDEAIGEFCDKKAIDVLKHEDYTMYPIEKVRTNEGKPFEIYTPFYRRAIRIPVPDPHAVPELKVDWVNTEVGQEICTDGDLSSKKFYEFNEHVEQKGGREYALDILHKIKKGGFRTYKKDRDIPVKDATTKLSASIKFGCVSIREVFKVSKEACGKASNLVANLYWREFYYNVAYHYPEILKGQIGERNTPMHGRYEKAKWNEDMEQFEKWKTGNTGFPIVDAGMRCMNKTGWMHNRLRMIVAMFLVKHLGFDWRWGEKYFAQKLVDYDAPNNSQGWCWCLGYRRLFNPYRQQGTHDPWCEYVKKWVPELADVPVLDIITWWESHTKYPNITKPMIEIQGYRVKFKLYIPDYKRPKPEKKKEEKPKNPNKPKNTRPYKLKQAEQKAERQRQRQMAAGGAIEGQYPLPPPPPPPPPRVAMAQYVPEYAPQYAPMPYQYWPPPPPPPPRAARTASKSANTNLNQQ